MSIIASLRRWCSLPNVQNTMSIAQRILYSTTKSITLEYDRDPQALFTDPETQKLLFSMTQLQISKVFQKHKPKDADLEYKFMTSNQLEEAFCKTIKQAKEYLQMPPVVQVKKDNIKVLSKDGALKDFSDTKYVITDITFGLRASDRKVLIRQTDGNLEYAPFEVRKRMNQLYFPLNGRKMHVPRMFEDEHLKRCLDEHKYEFILDRLTVQFEPYEQQFHDITSKAYQHLNESKEFDMLRSTRHFGPMAFFYAWHRCIDDLLYDMIRRDFLRNGVELIALMYKIHNVDVNYSELLKRLESLQPSVDPALMELRKSIKSNNDDIHEEIKTAIGKSREDFESDELCLTFIEHYVSQHALKKVQLELAIQTLKEINAEKKQLYEGLSKAHGVQQT